MQIVTVQFQYPHRSDYDLLLKVFKHSCKVCMPDVNFIEIKIPPPPARKGRDLNFAYNTVKLEKWLNILEHTKENTIFADCDMLAVKSAKHAFNIDFDVAYTERTMINRIPMNGGIMMARPTEAARKFFREMLYVNNLMFENIPFHNYWRKTYAGMNQSAFGCVYETGKHGAKVHKYKTIEWNAVDCDWSRVNGSTVFIHYKSKLRKTVLREIRMKPEFHKMVDIWDDMKALMIRDNK